MRTDFLNIRVEVKKCNQLSDQPGYINARTVDERFIHGNQMSKMWEVYRIETIGKFLIPFVMILVCLISMTSKATIGNSQQFSGILNTPASDYSGKSNNLGR